MKRFLCVLLSAVSLFSALSVTAFAAEKDRAATKKILARFDAFDADSDGKVASSDALYILKAAIGIEEMPKNKSLDADGDGKVTTSDALKVLRCSLGIEDMFSSDEILEYLRTELNWVKSRKPGFQKTRVDTCTSMKVTVKGASSLNANMEEYSEYLKRVKNYTESMKSILLRDMTEEEYEKMIAQLDKSIAEAEQAKVPKETKRTVQSGTSQHYYYFPVTQYTWSCKLTSADVKDVSLVYQDGKITITVNMNNYSYDATTYPYESGQYSERLKLPYGKVFDLPTYNTNSDTAFKAIWLKNGNVTVEIDASTGGVINANYAYDYTVDIINKQKTATNNYSMTVKQVSKMSENYVINPITD